MSSYWATTICSVLLCVKLSGSSNLQALGGVSLLGNYNLQGRFRFIMFLNTNNNNNNNNNYYHYYYNSTITQR